MNILLKVALITIGSTVVVTVILGGVIWIFERYGKSSVADKAVKNGLRYQSDGKRGQYEP
jgi:hypothetical protein